MRTAYFLLALLPAVVFGGLLSDSIIKILITSDGGEHTRCRPLCRRRGEAAGASAGPANNLATRLRDCVQEIRSLISRSL